MCPASTNGGVLPKVAYRTPTGRWGLIVQSDRATLRTVRIVYQRRTSHSTLKTAAMSTYV